MYNNIMLKNKRRLFPKFRENDQTPLREFCIYPLKRNNPLFPITIYECCLSEYLCLANKRVITK